MSRKDRRRDAARRRRVIDAEVPIIGQGANGQRPSNRIVRPDGKPNLTEFEIQVRRLQQVIDIVANEMMRDGVPRQAIINMMQQPVRRGLAYPIYVSGKWQIVMLPIGRGEDDRSADMEARPD